MDMISANSSLFSVHELRLSMILRECSAIYYALLEYEFLILGSKHPVILFTDHKPIIYLFTQKSKPNHRILKLQLVLMKFPNLHIVWTEGKNLSLPDLISRSITPHHPTTTRTEPNKEFHDLPPNLRFFWKSPTAADGTWMFLPCKNRFRRSARS